MAPRVRARGRSSRSALREAALTSRAPKGAPSRQSVGRARKRGSGSCSRARRSRPTGSPPRAGAAGATRGARVEASSPPRRQASREARKPRSVGDEVRLEAVRTVARSSDRSTSVRGCPRPGGSCGPSEARMRSGRARGAAQGDRSGRASRDACASTRLEARDERADGNQQGLRDSAEARASVRPWKARRVTGVHFRKGTRTAALGDPAARHAAKSPESFDEEGPAKGRPSEPDRREPKHREVGARGSWGARETDASSRRARPAKANPAHRAPHRVHVVEGRLQAPSTKHRAHRFCGRRARRRSRSREVVLPSTANRAEVDERQRTGPNRSGSKPSHPRVGSSGARRVARVVVAP